MSETQKAAAYVPDALKYRRFFRTFIQNCGSIEIEEMARLDQQAEPGDEEDSAAQIKPNGEIGEGNSERKRFEDYENRRRRGRRVRFEQEDEGVEGNGEPGGGLDVVKQAHEPRERGVEKKELRESEGEQHGGDPMLHVRRIIFRRDEAEARIEKKAEAEGGKDAGQGRAGEKGRTDFGREEWAAAVFGVPGEDERPEDEAAKKECGFQIPDREQAFIP